jgi:polar amino acid transport system substrate-binding protein
MLLMLAPALVLGGPPGAAQTGVEDAADADEPFAVPKFRHVDPHAPVPPLRAVRTVRFITDEDFPPFSYRDAHGQLTGFNVVLAEAVCADLRLSCEFVIRPWEELMDALEADEGDVILAGLRVSDEALEVLDFTRPYYRTTARFAVRAETLDTADPRSLAGRPVGVLAGTAHEAFLAQHFKAAEITAFDDETEAREALRTGGIDALFDDALRHMFWLAAEASRACCAFAGGAYVEPDYFSVPLAMEVRRGDDTLREVLDYGLDRVQMSGDYDAVFRLFFPMSPW